MTERSGGQTGILSCSIAFFGRGVAVRVGSLRQDLKHRKHNFTDRFSRHLSALILFPCAAANGAVNGIGRGFWPFRDAPSARSGAANAERPRLGAFMLILIIYLYYTEYFTSRDVVSCGRHARSDGTFMRLFERYRRRPNATERGAEKGRHESKNRCDIAQRMGGENAQKPTRTALKAGTNAFGGVILGGRPISEECA